MINTLNVATDGLIKDKSTISIAARGYINVVTVIFIEGTAEVQWNLAARDTSWATIIVPVVWIASDQTAEWKTDSLQTTWQLVSQNTSWKLAAQTINLVWNIPANKTTWILDESE